MQLLAFSALAFAWLKLANIYPPELKSVNLDTEWFYRHLFPESVKTLLNRLIPVDQAIKKFSFDFFEFSQQILAKHHGAYGILARSWPTGSMVLWVAVLLGLSLLLYYF